MENYIYIKCHFDLLWSMDILFSRFMVWTLCKQATNCLVKKRSF